MRKIIVVIGLAVVLAALGGGTAVAGTAYTRVVSSGGSGCAGASSANNYSTIDDALADQQPGDTIFVCAGTYPEAATPIITQVGLQLLGPASTAADDGTAVVQIIDPQNTGVIADADHVTVSGLTFDLTAAGQPSTGATGFGLDVTIRDNVFEGATSYGIYFNYNGPYHFNDNTIDTNAFGIYCQCNNSDIGHNVITDTSATGIQGISASGTGNEITANTLNAADVTAYGPGQEIFGNTLDGQGVANGFSIGFGTGIVFSGNTLKNVPADHFALSVDEGNGDGTAVRIVKNTFDGDGNPIILDDQSGGGITATIGGTAADANTFVNSGGSVGDAQLLLQMDGISQNQDATFNDWGLCSASDIADEIQDHADVPSLGTVDYSNFIEPADCSGGTSTPAPTPTPTVSPTPSGTPQPTVTPVGQRPWGDVDCGGSVVGTDALQVLTFASGITVPRVTDCGKLGEQTQLDDPPGQPLEVVTWGDLDCDDDVDTNDALLVLAYDADAPATPVGDCRAIGDPVIPDIG